MQVQHNGNDYERGDHVNVMESIPMQDYLNSIDGRGDIPYMDGIDPHADPPAVDIRLDEPEPIEPSSSTQVNYMDATEDREMEEKKGFPSLIPAPGTSATQLPAMDTSEDTDMSGIGESQDSGVGGAASHVEEVRR